LTGARSWHLKQPPKTLFSAAQLGISSLCPADDEKSRIIAGGKFLPYNE